MDAAGFPHELHVKHFARHASSFGESNSFNASAVLDENQRHTIRIVATVTSSISLAAAICAMYWFIIMRRNFRRDLVLMLIAGGFWKSLWFVVFSAVSFARGQVETESYFCQASGYSLQVGFEACDIAVLFMSMHMYYQIFPPSRSRLGHDGLYRVRRWVIALWVVFPNLTAGLAFLNPQHAYLAQGAFCSIPLRPSWYRLGLFWIPRYLIWIYIVFVAIRIYRHVGSEFKIFGQEKPCESSMDIPKQPSIDRATANHAERSQKRRHSNHDSPVISKARHDSTDDKIAPDDASQSRSPRNSRRGSNISLTMPTGRHHSTPNWSTDMQDFGVDTDLTALRSKSTPTSPRGSRQFAPIEAVVTPEISLFKQRHGSAASTSTRKSEVGPSTIPTLTPIEEGDGSQPETPCDPRDRATAAMNQRRRAIQRQLRLLFIYPVVYMMLWVFPFVGNIMNYMDYYAQHPNYPLQIIQVVMLTVMTHVDVVVFSWRERPWRHIPGSDGTFLGSFMWWRYCFDDAWVQGRRTSRALSVLPEDNKPETPKLGRQPRLWVSLHSSMFRKSPSPSNSHASSTNSAPPRSAVTHKRAHSGGSDRRVLEAERAIERLALERAEYELHRRSLQETTPERKEWFDKALESDLFTESDRHSTEKHEEV